MLSYCSIESFAFSSFCLGISASSILMASVTIDPEAGQSFWRQEMVAWSLRVRQGRRSVGWVSDWLGLLRMRERVWWKLLRVQARVWILYVRWGMASRQCSWRFAIDRLVLFCRVMSSFMIWMIIQWVWRTFLADFILRQMTSLKKCTINDSNWAKIGPTLN